jgi:beta-hydroxylase
VKAEAVRLAFNWCIERLCADADRTFFDPRQFDWIETFESRWKDVRAELEALLQRQNEIPAFHEVSTKEKPISDSRWKTFFFRIYGNEIAEARRLCPTTASMIDEAPDLTTVFFSILDPGKHIPAHRGPYKGVLRYHLGLLVPAGGTDCAIRVGQDVRGWREGGSLVFDDTHEHEAWNDTPAPRAVLFADFVRPMPGVLGRVNRAVLFAAKYLHSDVLEVKRKARIFCLSMLAQAPSALPSPETPRVAAPRPNG